MCCDLDLFCEPEMEGKMKPIAVPPAAGFYDRSLVGREDSFHVAHKYHRLMPWKLAVFPHLSFPLYPG